MKTKHFDTIILSGDIGGTNTNLALMGKNKDGFTQIFDRHYKTQEEKSLLEPLSRFLNDAKVEVSDFVYPEIFCISGAGPVVNNSITLTNAPWNIDLKEIEKHLGIKGVVINDFTAISYGVVLLDAENTSEITQLTHTDGSLPKAENGTRLVVGAGTGLGTGYLNPTKAGLVAYPSEGGHISLTPYDDETIGLYRYLAKKFNEVPGAESAVSGLGIANIYAYLHSLPSYEKTAIVQEIHALKETDRPAMIAKNIKNDALCARVMDIFTKLYARVCANACLTFLPSGGLYLAGGIAAKNEAFFLEDNRFMEAFESSYREHTQNILRRVPVYIVRNYDVSLYGAANAAITLLS